MTPKRNMSPCNLFRVYTLICCFCAALLYSSPDISAFIAPSVTGFAYDANGNMTVDPVRGINRIVYNHLNLPTEITFASGHRQTITYDGLGRKIRVDYAEGPETVLGQGFPVEQAYQVRSSRYYVGPHIFSDGKLEYSSFEGGYFDPEGGTMYNLTDWQGNNAAVVSNKGDIVQKTTYYPYGEPTVEPVGQRFLFGGKEREHAAARNTYDFSARCLTPYGNWNVNDQKAEKYYNLSPYSYCGGDPINFIDPDGKDIFEFNSKGALTNIIKENRYDLVRITTSSGRVQQSVFEYRTIRNLKKVKFKNSPGSYYFNVNGLKNSYDIFIMLATNTDSEWGWIQAQNKSSGEMENYIGTSLSPREEKISARILFKNISAKSHILKRVVHSHPNNSYPSGCPEDCENPEDKEKGDIAFAREIQSLYPDFDSFEVFRVRSLLFEKYNKDSSSEDFAKNPPEYINKPMIK